MKREMNAERSNNQEMEADYDSVEAGVNGKWLARPQQANAESPIVHFCGQMPIAGELSLSWLFQLTST
jgi:hypothetical protein